MTKEGIIKLAKLNKSAGGLFGLASDAGTLLLCAAAAIVAGGGFASGVLYSRATAPRLSDILNVTKLYRVQKLQNDLHKQKALLLRLKIIYDDQKTPKKSVYGIV